MHLILGYTGAGPRRAGQKKGQGHRLENGLKLPVGPVGVKRTRARARTFLPARVLYFLRIQPTQVMGPDS